MKADLLEYDEEQFLEAPISLVRESQIKTLMKAFDPYLQLIPPVSNGKANLLTHPEFCYSGDSKENGFPCCVWIYFKEHLSIEMVTIYFDSIDKKYITDMMHTLFAYFSDAVELIEASQTDGNWSQISKSKSFCSH